PSVSSRSSARRRAHAARGAAVCSIACAAALSWNVPYAGAAPVDNGPLGALTDQSSLDGTVAAPDAIANPADVDAALGSAVQSLSGSAGSPDPGLAESIGGEAGC